MIAILIILGLGLVYYFVAKYKLGSVYFNKSAIGISSINVLIFTALVFVLLLFFTFEFLNITIFELSRTPFHLNRKFVESLFAVIFLKSDNFLGCYYSLFWEPFILMIISLLLIISAMITAFQYLRLPLTKEWIDLLNVMMSNKNFYKESGNKDFRGFYEDQKNIMLSIEDYDKFKDCKENLKVQILASSILTRQRLLVVVFKTFVVFWISAIIITKTGNDLKLIDICHDDSISINSLTRASYFVTQVGATLGLGDFIPNVHIAEPSFKESFSIFIVILICGLNLFFIVTLVPLILQYLFTVPSSIEKGIEEIESGFLIKRISGRVTACPYITMPKP
jgi:hypothetical protein